MKTTARLVCMEHNQEITQQEYPQFWFEYQRAILLALKEQAILTEIAYQYAENQLKQQFRTAALKYAQHNAKEKGRGVE